MITADGWFDWAQRVPGPADKTNPGANPVKIYVPHSAVGFYSGWTSRLFSNARNPDGSYTKYAAVSVHGFILYDGRLIQHYPVWKRCWGSGNGYLNNNGIAVENEGGFDPVNEPLREGQVAANVRVLEDLQAVRSFGPEYWRRPASASDLTATLYEHNEGTRFGGLPTACPSGRIPWAELLHRLNEEDDMMKVYNAFSEWFESRRFDEAQVDRDVWVSRDMGIVDKSPKMARLEVTLRSGSVVFGHGAGAVAPFGGYAYAMDAKDEPHATFDVALNAVGDCVMSCSAWTEFERVGLLGYW